MRIYKTIDEAVEELQRDLMVRGETVECKTYQDKELKGEEKNIKELIGVTYKVLNPLVKHEEAIKVIYPDEEKAKQIIDYIDVEYMDRTSGVALNPVNEIAVSTESTKNIREAVSTIFTEDGNKHKPQEVYGVPCEYTYSDGINPPITNKVIVYT